VEAQRFKVNYGKHRISYVQHRLQGAYLLEIKNSSQAIKNNEEGNYMEQTQRGAQYHLGYCPFPYIGR